MAPLVGAGHVHGLAVVGRPALDPAASARRSVARTAVALELQLPGKVDDAHGVASPKTLQRGIR